MAASLDPKPWGGHRLAQFGKLVSEEPIGESLESGSESRVTNGLLAGRTLGELALTHQRSLLGTRGQAAARERSDFPLLVKLIDASENLSVQVHPNDDHAPAGKRGKTEAWLILDAAPGARIVTGVEGFLDRERISDQIVSVEVSAGEVYFIRAGTIHAIGAGVLLYEVQQASDVTYRLYDWGRKREMHLDDGVRSADVTLRVARMTPVRIDRTRELLAACEYFALERWTIRDRHTLPRSPETFRVVTVLSGQLTAAGVAATSGDTLVLPADLPPSTFDGSAVIVVAYIPGMAADGNASQLDARHDGDPNDAAGAFE